MLRVSAVGVVYGSTWARTPMCRDVLLALGLHKYSVYSPEVSDTVADKGSWTFGDSKFANLALLRPGTATGWRRCSRGHTQLGCKVLHSLPKPDSLRRGR